MTSRSRALWLTARPKTLSASVVPVMVATALVAGQGLHVTAWISLCAVLSAIMIQVGTNFVNDALDFVKGADKDTRLGEARASQQGWFTHKMVLGLGFGFFFLAFVMGVPLVLVGGWAICLVGILSLLMGYLYTGGPYPLAYVGLGDLFVILFFGLIAVGGVYFLQTADYSVAALVAGLQIGFLATVLIAINNLRDLDQDREVGKRTLAVRLGPRRGRLEVAALVLGAYLLNFYWLQSGHFLAFALPFLSMPLAVRLVLAVLKTEAGRSFNQFLARAALIHMLFGMLLSLGLILK